MKVDDSGMSVPVCDVTVGHRVCRACDVNGKVGVSAYEANARWQGTLPVRLLKWMILMFASAWPQVTLTGHREGQTDRQAGRQTDRQADRETGSFLLTLKLD